MALWPTTLRIGDKELKLLVTSPEGDDLLKARLPIQPPHPRALLTLLEGVALWSGEPLYAVISAGEPPRRLARLRSSGATSCGPPKARSSTSTSRSPRPRRAARSAASVTSATCADSFAWSGLDEAARPLRRVAEVLRLGLVEGVAVRAIAKRLGMARKTVRKILGRHRAPPKPAAEPRGSILDPYETAIRAVLDDTPEMLAPAVLERLRPLGYTGGVTILRARLRASAPARTSRGVPDARLRAGRGDAGRLGRLRLRAARRPAPRQRVRRRPLLLAPSLHRVHAQPVHGHLPALHGAVPALLRGHHRRRHLRQHEDGRALAHRRPPPSSIPSSSSTPALAAASPCAPAT